MPRASGVQRPFVAFAGRAGGTATEDHATREARPPRSGLAIEWSYPLKTDLTLAPTLPTEIVLRPRVALPAGVDQVRVRRTLERAEKTCLVSASLSTPIRASQRSPDDLHGTQRCSAGRIEEVGMGDRMRCPCLT